MMRHRLFLLLLTLLLPGSLTAQVRLSEQASVKQVINGTTITIEYYRPVARGRDTLFGKVVHWNETWTPGANWATTIETDRDIRLYGLPVPKGKYSVWMVPVRDSAWTVFLNKKPRLFHTRRPKGTDDDIVRFKVSPHAGPHMEALMWYFPTVQRDSTILRMHWGTTMVDIGVLTTPMARAVLSEDQRGLYVGKWEMKYEGSTEAEAIEILTEGDKLIMRAVATKPEEAYESEMIPVSEHQFRYGEREKGVVVEVADHPLNFVVEGSRAVSFEILNADTKKVMARGQRKK
jgi:hypothetical protein